MQRNHEFLQGNFIEEQSEDLKAPNQTMGFDLRLGRRRLNSEIISKPQYELLWIIMLVSCDYLFAIAVRVSVSKMRLFMIKN